MAPPVLVAKRPRRPRTVYECDACEARQLGHQRCELCGAFMRRVGYGGISPCCDEPVAFDEILTS